METNPDTEEAENVYSYVYNRSHSYNYEPVTDKD